MGYDQFHFLLDLCNLRNLWTILWLRPLRLTKLFVYFVVPPKAEPPLAEKFGCNSLFHVHLVEIGAGVCGGRVLALILRWIAWNT